MQSSVWHHTTSSPCLAFLFQFCFFGGFGKISLVSLYTKAFDQWWKSMISTPWTCITDFLLLKNSYFHWSTEVPKVLVNLSVQIPIDRWRILHDGNRRSMKFFLPLRHEIHFFKLVICLQKRNDSDMDVSLKAPQLISGKMAKKSSVFQDRSYIINILHDLIKCCIIFFSVAV